MIDVDGAKDAAAQVRQIRSALDDLGGAQSLQQIVRQSRDPWLKRLIIIAGVCVALTLVLFVAFKITLSSGASDLQRSAVETKG